MASSVSRSGVNQSQQSEYTVLDAHVIRILDDLCIALKNCEWQQARIHSESLTAQGRRVIALQIAQKGKELGEEYDPLPMVLDLIRALEDERIQLQFETKYQIARATRLFLELMCRKCAIEKGQNLIYDKTKTKLRVAIDLLLKHSNHVGLSYELSCCSEALKLIENTDVTSYLSAIFKAVSDPGLGSVVALSGLIPDLMAKKSKEWFLDVLFINWWGDRARDNEEFYYKLCQLIENNFTVLEMLQAGVEFLGDIAQKATLPQLRMEAIQGTVGLIRILYHDKPNMWPARYRAVQTLSLLMTNPPKDEKYRDTMIRISQISKTVLQAQCDIEKHPRVKDLFEMISRQPASSESTSTSPVARLVVPPSPVRNTAKKTTEVALRGYFDFSGLIRSPTQREKLSPSEGSSKQFGADLPGEVFPHPTRGLESSAGSQALQSTASTHTGIASSPLEEPRARRQSLSLRIPFLNRRTQFADPNLLTVNELRLAAAREDENAQWTLGLCYYNGDGVPQDFAEALLLMENAAQKGNPILQRRLGGFYYHGIGNNQSFEKAAEWYLRAARQGNAEAQLKIGLCYEEGTGVPKNLSEAVMWYMIAAQQNEPEAQNRVGEYYYHGKVGLQDYNEAFSWFQKSAERNNPNGQKHLADCYYYGHGVRQDIEEAARLYGLSAEQGNEKAEHCLGDCYYFGEGVVQNYELAAYWYLRAAKHGHPEAQHRIGMCYQNGEGVTQNMNEALKWLQKASQNGHQGAKKALENTST